MYFDLVELENQSFWKSALFAVCFLLQYRSLVRCCCPLPPLDNTFISLPKRTSKEGLLCPGIFVILLPVARSQEEDLDPDAHAIGKSRMASIDIMRPPIVTRSGRRIPSRGVSSS
jgi:hypothetical protein